MGCDFYLFRHGQTDYNLSKQMQGHLDIPLNSTGILQAKELAKNLSDVRFDYIYSSPLLRSVETVKIVSEKSNAKIIIDEGLKAWNFGIFCGKVVHLIDAPVDTTVYAHADTCTDVYIPIALVSNDDWAPQNGESYNMFSKRVYDTIIKITQNTDAKAIGIATHGGVIKAIIKQFTDLEYPRDGIPNGEYMKMQWNGKKFILVQTPSWLLTR